VGLFYNAPEPTRGGGLGKEQLFNNVNALAYRGADISPLQPPYSEHTHTRALVTAICHSLARTRGGQDRRPGEAAEIRV